MTRSQAERGAGEAGECIYGLARKLWIVRRVSGLKNPASSNVALHALFDQSISYFNMAMRMNAYCCYYISQGEISLCQKNLSTVSYAFPRVNLFSSFYLSIKFLSVRFYLSLYSIFWGILSKRFRNKTVTIKAVEVFKSMGVRTISSVSVTIDTLPSIYLNVSCM